MNKRQKIKKKLKVKNRELWNLDYTIAEWIIPRLKQFKKINIGYPGRPPMDTPEKWDAAIDKMILSFEMVKKDPIDVYHEEFHSDYDQFKKKSDEYMKTIQEGLHLFAEYYLDLWI